ncbi:diaminopimelate decarboxylase [Oenococcus kitaharae]|uniref:Diaminopimelate decarboxylase n=1 Tax=Oenococcus kitaharae DSM 17330 TaxID=1045004 RepID=G9WGE0_9LACO|nr:diaminopimelate decarboxylase [Oenococcus kitaharae]EHN59748.1 Diaminopimelate decarboxylase [Oenococcus kitaharae DSM 17330]OEY83576.1 diaminopimelate decarboxylase [Oenococcus kitaharae]OEY85374.1 diaminopimelate decarboxylase [Oenococcus kitaharae]OEY86227.1 diaminopimelate decarboxylase [Oenococcus kitaharae]
MQIQNNQLYIGGLPASEIAKRFQTPLYVYDVGQIRKTIREMKEAFQAENVAYEISYASKAFSVVAMYDVLAAEKIHCDVVSGGELATVMKAGFPLQKVAFNGNNKSFDELSTAIDHHIGTVIVDNFHEIELLEEILSAKNQMQDVLMRISPGISAHTHEFISTGQQDSKFGFDLISGQAKQAFDLIMASPHLHLRGLHAHIGSQIFETNGYSKLADLLVKTASDWHFQPDIIDLGGGFGIKYNEKDDPIPNSDFIHLICQSVKQAAKAYNIQLPEIWIEPGRSIVGPAGYSLYTIGGRKDIPGIRSYLSVDGGMGDNIRPALYQAEYEALLADQADLPSEQVVRIAGKYCESGDVLVWQQKLPKTKPGDLLAILATGAYGYSMASNYNRNPRPAVVFAENGQAKLVVKRESMADITHLDLDYEVGND